MAGPRRILLLSYHFHPSPEVGAKRVTALAMSLRDRGLPVTVIAAGDAAADAPLDGIRQLQIKPPPRLYALLRSRLPRRAGGAGETRAVAGGHRPPRPADPLRRGLAWLKRHYHAMELLVDHRKLWSLKALLALLRELRREPAILISSGPPMSPHLSALIASRLYRLPWIMDLRDPWVGNGIRSSAASSALRAAIERRLEALCLSRAQQITVTAPGLLNKLMARRPELDHRIRLILNGFDGEPLPHTAPAARLRLIYAGNLYLNRNPFPLLSAFAAFLARAEVRREAVSFLMIGHCAQWNGVELAPWAAANGIADGLEIRAPVAPAALEALLAEADVGVVFAQGQPDQIPAKIYDYIGAGREMLVIAEADSDTARLVRYSGCGRVVAPDDPAAMVDALIDLHDDYVVRRQRFQVPDAAYARFSRSRQNGEFLELIEKI